MGFPADLHTVAVSGTILNPADGTPATGTVTFAMPYPLRDVQGHVIVGNTPITATLVNGAFTVSLPATDQSQISPLNWVYTVTINTSAAYSVFQAALPQSPSSTTLDQMVPVVTPPAVGIYLLLAMLGQPGGAASLDNTGRLPESQLPSGGGVPDATTSTKGVVELAGDLAGTATAVQVVDTHLAAPLPVVQGGTGVTSRTWELAANKGAVNGYAGLDLNSHVPAAQLPIGSSSGTVAAGDDPRIVTALQPTLVTAKGDLLVATGSAAVARLAAGADGYLLTADSAQADGVKWAPAPAAGVTSVNTRAGAVTLTSADVGLAAVNNTSDANKPISTAAGIAYTIPRPLLPLSFYGLIAGSIHLDQINNHASDNLCHGAVVWLPGNTTYTKVSTWTFAAGTAGAGGGLGGPNGFSVWTLDGATQLASTVDDPTMWQVAAFVEKTLTASITTPNAGQFVCVEWSVHGYDTPPQMHYAVSNSTVATNPGSPPALAARRAWYATRTAWPATLTGQQDATGYVPAIYFR